MAELKAIFDKYDKEKKGSVPIDQMMGIFKLLGLPATEAL
jgi:Ca2+-binding EF-hand superfamily protein